MKRSQDESATCSTTKKRRVDYATFQKWQRDLDREYQTMTWLDCSSEKERGKKVVVQLKCKVCSGFVEKIRGRKNFSEKWIVGADSVRVSNVRDHAQNDQHTHTVCMYAEAHGNIATMSADSDYLHVHVHCTCICAGTESGLKRIFGLSRFKVRI